MIPDRCPRCDRPAVGGCVRCELEFEVDQGGRLVVRGDPVRLKAFLSRDRGRVPVTMAEITRRLDVDEATTRKWVRSGVFPEPVLRAGPGRSVAVWWWDDVWDWVTERALGRRARESEIQREVAARARGPRLVPKRPGAYSGPRARTGG